MKVNEHQVEPKSNSYLNLITVTECDSIPKPVGVGFDENWVLKSRSRGQPGKKKPVAKWQALSRLIRERTCGILIEGISKQGMYLF
jgi:hypothetical protein